MLIFYDAHIPLNDVANGITFEWRIVARTVGSLTLM